MTANRLAILGGTPAVRLAHPADWPILDAETKEAVLEVLNEGVISEYRHGVHVQRLEDEIRRYFDDIPYVLACSTGTSALHSAYVGIGLSPEDEVIVPCYTFMATVMPLFLCGAVPVLCDADPISGNVTAALIEEKITAKTAAIVVTHMWGLPAEMDAIVALATRKGLKLIEDCSHAHGSKFKGQKVGTFGDVGIFSMGAQKMVTGGMGGVLITRDPDIYDRALLLGHCRGRAGDTLVSDAYGDQKLYGLGENYRISTVSAVICRRQFETLDARIDEKHRNLMYLKDVIDAVPQMRSPLCPNDRFRGGWYGFKAHYEQPWSDQLSMDKLLATLQAEGVNVKRPGSPPLHTFDAFKQGHLNFWGSSRTIRFEPSRAEAFPGATAFHQSAISFATTRFHYQCAELFDEYAIAFNKLQAGWDDLVTSKGAQFQ